MIDKALMQTGDPSDRGTWASKVGFILAAAGSAIGLGNIWRFPYTVGEGGGAVFVFVYIVFVACLGFPVMVSEITVGRYAKRSTVGAYGYVGKHRFWRYVGGLGVVTGIGILSYYGVVAGWTLGYACKVVSGELTGGMTPDVTEKIFLSYVGSPVWGISGLFVFIALTTLVVLGGIQKGIERLSKILMPVLFALLLVVVVRGIIMDATAENTWAGIRFYLMPDFSKLTLKVVIEALGQAFFSLSLGMGVMITYGSYIPKSEDIMGSAAWVCFADLAIALLAGLAIFPALFAIGMDPAKGPGLIFVVLPCVFDAIPFGHVFGFVFFLLLILAALTSTISLLEVITAYLVDEKGMKRSRAALLAAATCFLVGIPSALSVGAVGWLSKLYDTKGEGKSFLDLMDLVWGNFSLVVGALFISIFVGWVWKRNEVMKELEQGSLAPAWFRGLWFAFVRLVCPLGIAILLVNLVVTLFR
jgi:NSS family neurotransmitter:Na+ symporter